MVLRGGVMVAFRLLCLSGVETISPFCGALDYGSIAAQYAPIQGQSCKEPGSFPVYLAPADIRGTDGLDTLPENGNGLLQPRPPPCMRVIGGTRGALEDGTLPQPQNWATPFIQRRVA